MTPGLNGWNYFVCILSQCLHPLEVTFGVDRVTLGKKIGNKVGFKFEAIDFIKKQSILMTPVEFHLYCVSLATFCKELHESSTALEISGVVNTDIGPIITAMVCNQILEQTLIE